MPSLILMFRDKILNAHPLNEGGAVTIGRHQSNDIVIENLAVSGYHARIDHRPEGFLLIDLQSKNGTFLNDEPVTTMVLRDRDRIVVGKHTLLVDLEDSVTLEDTLEEGPAEAPTSSALATDRTMALETPGSQPAQNLEPPEQDPVHPPEDTLLFLAGGMGEINLTGKTSISIGSNKDADIVVGGLWGLFIGGPGAVIKKQAGSYVMRYTGGLVKPKRNGSRVRGTVQLNHEDIVAVGPVKLQIQLRLI